MTPTISKLWNGHLQPIERFGKYNREMQNLERLIDSNYKELEKYLDKKESERFEKYKSRIEEYTFLACEQSFCDGYCLATKITAEAFIGADEIVK